MILLNICHIVVLKLSSGEVALFNAEQSSTWCFRGTCYNASRAIDGNWNTYSYTGYATGTELWLQVSMPNTIVYQIVLRAYTYYSGEDITVSLYSGETLAGQCESHSGSSASTETLSCAKVTADRVRLALSSTSWTNMWVYEITVEPEYLKPGERHKCMLCK